MKYGFVALTHQYFEEEQLLVSMEIEQITVEGPHVERPETKVESKQKQVKYV